MRTRLDRSPVDYQVLRTNETWPEHTLRTFVTAGSITWLEPQSVIDPACGDGSLVRTAHSQRPIPYAVLSDLSRKNVQAMKPWLPDGWGTDVDDALALLGSQINDSYDVVVLTEVLEHLVDPDALLREARRIGKYLVVSSPEMRTDQIDSNPEHLWMFDENGYRIMLEGAGWEVGPKTKLSFDSMYDFQIWVCK